MFNGMTDIATTGSKHKIKTCKQNSLLQGTIKAKA